MARCLDNTEQFNKVALRELVKDQITRYRQRRVGEEAQTFASDLSGQVFPIGELHIDHADPSFNEIVAGFCEAEGLVLGEQVLTMSAPGNALTVFRDQELEQRFKVYHQDRAVLRIVSRGENLGELRRA